MKPLNFLRDAIDSINKNVLPGCRFKYPSTAEEIKNRLEEATRAEKFILPNEGRILDDEMKALPDELKLPFPAVVLEYTCVTDSIGLPEQLHGKEKTTSAPKRIVIAMQEKDFITVFSVVFYEYENGERSWGFMPFKAIIMNEVKREPGSEAPKVSFGILPLTDDGMTYRLLGDGWEVNARVDIMDECRAVLEVVEALSCSNVGFSDHFSSAKPNLKQKKGKIPFDSYRVLTVQTSNSDSSKEPIKGTSHDGHASPREHVRRGHIRRYASGLKIWINNTIVNPGSGGKIMKTYSIVK